MAEQIGPEPTGWELMRSIEQLRKTVEGFASGTVSAATLALVQKGWDEKHTAMGREIGELRADLKAQKTTADLAKIRDDEQRGRNRWTLIALVASPFVYIIVQFVISGALRP